jgi:hypothetical protein
MSTQHTPGPWKFGSKADSKFYKRNISGADGYHVAAVSSRNEHEVDANARLIAAAPDLLEALELCQSNISSLLASAHPKVYGEWLTVVSAAIAKATGEPK